MLQTKFEIKGLKELDNLLTQLPRQVARKEMAAALRAGAVKIRQAAKARAPVRQASHAIAIRRRRGPANKGRMPGFLRASIGIRTLRTAREAAPHIVVTVGRAFYGMFSEFGTKHQPARPWLRPAAESAAGAAFAAIKETLVRRIAAAAERFSR